MKVSEAGRGFVHVCPRCERVFAHPSGQRQFCDPCRQARRQEVVEAERRRRLGKPTANFCVRCGTRIRRRNSGRKQPNLCLICREWRRRDRDAAAQRLQRRIREHSPPVNDGAVDGRLFAPVLTRGGDEEP